MLSPATQLKDPRRATNSKSPDFVKGCANQVSSVGNGAAPHSSLTGAGGAKANASRRPPCRGETEMNRLTVHDPRGYPPNVIGKRLAARPQSLVGKTLYLVDCLFDNSEAFMDQLKRWFAEHLPSVDTRMIKPRESWVDDPAMRQKIAADGHAAVLGVGL